MTFRRYAEDFKAKYYDRWILLREGQKALRDKVEPYIKRDPSVLNVGDALVADGHKLNFQVINPFNGRPCRATMIAYVDWKSYDLAGYEIMINENTQCIAAAMRNSIIRLGRVPLVSYQDNGKAFRARFFTGTDNLEESGLYGLFGRLNIVPVFAKPYNARAKIVERWFKEFSDTFERLFPSFIGSSIADRPAYMLRNEKLHKALHNEYVPTIEETVMLLEYWLEFHRSQECPHVKGKSIGEVFNEGRGQGVDIAELDDLMMDMKITNISRNGIRFLNQHYYDDNLYNLREQVIIRYSLFDLSHIKVYAMNGEYICTANRVMPVHPLAAHLGTPKDVEELKRNLSMQKRAEKKTIQGSKELMRIGKTAELDWQKVIEISPRIADRLEAEDIQTPAIEERIPDECVDAGDSPDSTASPVNKGQSPTRLEPSSRPIFESNIDRYEWHLQYGVFTDEDEAWCMWFRTTDEFRMLYSAFQNQGKEAGQ
jgi:putative transposase